MRAASPNATHEEEHSSKVLPESRKPRFGVATRCRRAAEPGGRICRGLRHGWRPVSQVHVPACRLRVVSDGGVADAGIPSVARLTGTALTRPVLKRTGAALKRRRRTGGVFVRSAVTDVTTASKCAYICPYVTNRNALFKNIQKNAW